uniref:Putative wd40 repeat in seven bladed beta propellers n=1 Tax=Culex tarsalis TaxID=7177 RepID=A0A1Q3EZI1_CULTA
MDYSKRMNMIEMFTDPPEYRPPATVEEMSGSVDYPNLNSQQYRMTRKPISPTVLNPCLELASRNSAGQVILVGNNYMGRRWDSSFYGWENAADIPDQSKACFKRQCKYSITAFRFTQDPNLFLLGSDKGSVELWSTRNPARGDGYSLYQVDVQSEHIEAVSAMDLFHGEENKLATGSHDGCIKVWVYGADLASITTMTYAHTDEITALSTNPNGPSTFATASLDRSALLWDLRKPRPATALFAKHPFAFTAAYWTTKTEANGIVALGDAAGGVHFVDTRQPNVFLHSTKVFNKKIHKISFNGTYFAVLGNTNRAKFYEGSQFDLLHESTPPASNYLRDVLWDKPGPGQTGACWLVGWDTFVRRVEF